MTDLRGGCFDYRDGSDAMVLIRHVPLRGIADSTKRESAPAPVALATGRSLLLLKQKSGYSVFYSVLTGKRKTGQSLLSQQLKQLDTPDKLVGFAFDQGIGFLPYAGYAMEVLQELKTKNNSPLRAVAARFLTHDPDPRSGQVLVKACSDDNWMVRAAALRAVAMRGDPTLLAGIQPAMQDHNNTVQYTAAAAVFHLASIKATE